MSTKLSAYERIAATAQRLGLSTEQRNLRHGYKDYRIAFDSIEAYGAAKKIFSALKGVHVDSRWMYGEGFLYLMDAKDYAELQAMLTAESEASEKWWQRYHAADRQTKLLMACGAID